MEEEGKERKEGNGRGGKGRGKIPTSKSTASNGGSQRIAENVFKRSILFKCLVMT